MIIEPVLHSNRVYSNRMMYVVMFATMFGFFVGPGMLHCEFREVLSSLSYLACSYSWCSLQRNRAQRTRFVCYHTSTCNELTCLLQISGALQGGLACVSSLSSIVGPPLLAGFFYAFTSNTIY